MRAEPEHRGILAVDIQGFGRLDRSNPARARMRAGLHRILGNAMTAAGIDPKQIAQTEYGDGVVVLLNPQISKARLLHPLLPRLASGLARYNRTAPDAARLRLRVVVHAGELLRDDHGITGEDLVLAFRLLDADAVRAHLTQAGTDLILVVSDVIFQGIVKHAYSGIDPARFQPIWVSTKETSVRAWLHLPDTRYTVPAPITSLSTPTDQVLTTPRTRSSTLSAGNPSTQSSPDVPTSAGRGVPGVWQGSPVVYVEHCQPGGSWVQFAPQVTSLFGHMVEDIAPNYWKTTLHPADRDRVLAADEWCEQTLEPWRITFRQTTRDGRAVWARDEAVVMYDEAGIPRYWLGMLFHLSDQAMAELDAAHWLEAVDQLRATFLTAASRNLRAPLTRILATCRTLEQAPSRRSERATSELFRGISANVGRLDRLLTDVIDLQRLDWGAMALQRRPFDIATLLEREAAQWRTEGGWPQVSTTSATVWLDPDKIERIIHELLDNVAKHTPSNTPVWVRTRRNGTGILLVVEDAGPGLPSDFHVSAFERLPGSKNIFTYPLTVGIGLSLVLRFAELHGGTAWIEDRPGGGTSVSVLLPGPSAPSPYTGVEAALPTERP
jgi:PAS domain S-box-containing protein